MPHKNEMINTCKVQRPAKSMTSRKKLTTPNYIQYKRATHGNIHVPFKNERDNICKAHQSHPNLDE